jgi:type I restriction enzyme M protein
MLVEEYLVAVVSLPAGVFNPYSGVKTSILILDKSLAKKANTIAFFKIENDGFGLGAQRREIDKNDLPQARAEIGEYLHRLRAGGSVEDLQPKLGLIMEKEKIAANGDYNLSGERYREAGTRATKWPMVKLGEICDFLRGPFGSSVKRSVCVEKGRDTYKVYEQGNVIQNDFIRGGYCISKEQFSELKKFEVAEGDILITCAGTLGRIAVVPKGIEQGIINSVLMRVRIKKSDVNQSYLVHLLQSQQIQRGIGDKATGVALKNMFATSELKQFEIPLPPPEVQKEIVAEIEGYQKVINGARAVLNNYRPHIPIHPDWPMVELGKACETIMDGTHFSPSNTETGDRLYITSKNVRENYLDLSNVSYISEVDHRAIYSRCPVRTGDVLYIKDGANTGLAAINTLTEEFSLLSSVAVMRGKPEMLSNRYLAFFLNSDQGRQSMLSMISGVAITRLTLTKLNAAMIPLPPLATQQAIVAEIEAEQALVAANRELIARFEKKIQATLARVWGEEA